MTALGHIWVEDVLRPLDSVTVGYLSQSDSEMRLRHPERVWPGDILKLTTPPSILDRLFRRKRLRPAELVRLDRAIRFGYEIPVIRLFVKRGYGGSPAQSWPNGTRVDVIGHIDPRPPGGKK